MGQNELGKILMEKGKGGASRPQPHFWPTGRSQPSPPARHPPPHASAHACVHVWTAARCRRGKPAELSHRVACMHRPRRALVGHQERPAAPASSSAAICTHRLLFSRSLALAPRAQSTAVAIGAPSSASAVLPQRMSHSSIRPSPSSALASPLRDMPPSAW